MISLTRAAVPTGTVLLVTTILPPFIGPGDVFRGREHLAQVGPARRYLGRAHRAMKTTSARLTASAGSVEKDSLLSRVLR